MSDTLVTKEDDYDFGVDPKPDDLIPPLGKDRTAVIRTSDRISFKRCRRRWGWSSHLRGGLGTREAASPLWYGSGFHFAMEDFHGLRQYSSATAAFEAYVKATYKMAKGRPGALPYDWPELTKLGRGMLGYYTDDWLVARDPLETYVVDGRPQVEVHALVEIPITASGYDKVYYGATLDRVTIDKDGLLWIVDYKTAKRIQTQFFQTDPQISSYCWIASKLYDRPIGGFIYQQHRKDVPADPRILANGRLSIADTQLTTHRHYRRCLINIYGSVDRAPAVNVDFLNSLNEIETSDQDKFVQRNKVFRNEYQIESEGTKILMEVADMLNPDLPLYPNATRECGHLCDFNSPCISMDDGSDWETELNLTMFRRDMNYDRWRDYLPPLTQEAQQ